MLLSLPIIYKECTLPVKSTGEGAHHTLRPTAHKIGVHNTARKAFRQRVSHIFWHSTKTFKIHPDIHSCFPISEIVRRQTNTQHANRRTAGAENYSYEIAWHPSLERFGASKYLQNKSGIKLTTVVVGVSIQEHRKTKSRRSPPKCSKSNPFNQSASVNRWCQQQQQQTSVKLYFTLPTENNKDKSPTT